MISQTGEDQHQAGEGGVNLLYEPSLPENEKRLDQNGDGEGGKMGGGSGRGRWRGVLVLNFAK